MRPGERLLPAAGKQATNKTNKWGTYGAFPSQVAEQTLVLLRGQEQGAHVDSPAGLWVAVHGSEFSEAAPTLVGRGSPPRSGFSVHRHLQRIHAGSCGLQPDHLSPTPGGRAKEKGRRVQPCSRPRRRKPLT